MTILATFNPSYGSGVTVAPTSTSASTNIGKGEKSLCLTDLTGVQMYVRVGTSGVTASAADYPIPLNGQVTITKSMDADYIAYYAPSGTGSLHIMRGEGF